MEQSGDNQVERLVMTVEEAGQALGISRATAYTLCNSGEIPALRLGKRRLIVPKAAINALLSKATTNDS